MINKFGIPGFVKILICLQVVVFLVVKRIRKALQDSLLVSIYFEAKTWQKKHV